MYPVRESDGASHRAVPISVARTRAIRASAEDRGSRCRIARHDEIAGATDRSRPIARDPPNRSAGDRPIDLASASRLLRTHCSSPISVPISSRGSLAIGAASGDPLAQGGPSFTVPRAHPRALTALRRGMTLDDSSPELCFSLSLSSPLLFPSFDSYVSKIR